VGELQPEREIGNGATAPLQTADFAISFIIIESCPNSVVWSARRLKYRAARLRGAQYYLGLSPPAEEMSSRMGRGRRSRTEGDHHCCCFSTSHPLVSRTRLTLVSALTTT
jgi:hypothetical protein